MLAIVTGFAVCVVSSCFNKHSSSSNYSTSYLWRFGANSEKYSSSSSPIIMSDKLKVDRGHSKTTVARLLGTLECLMAEDVAADVVAAKLKDVKAAFGDLEVDCAKRWPDKLSFCMTIFYRCLQFTLNKKTRWAICLRTSVMCSALNTSNRDEGVFKMCRYMFGKIRLL